MSNFSLHIKNMVCDRCKLVVQNTLQQQGLQPLSVTLGTVELAAEPTKVQLKQLKNQLQEVGFELLEDDKTRLVEAIKNSIINQVHYPQEERVLNFSAILSEQLHRDYSWLSSLFKEVTGTTIEQFIIRQKVERAKELLSYNQKTLTEIADELQYSSVAHLSNQFKKITGTTPSQYKNQKKASRQELDKL